MEASKDNQSQRGRCARLVLPLLLLGTVGCGTLGPLVGACSPCTHCVLCPKRDRHVLERDWDQWARENLEPGDVVFGMGDARACFGLFRFSRVSSKMAGSRYSHTGLIACEDGDMYVYDMAPCGARRLSFAEYVLDDEVVNLAVKRVGPEHRGCADEAVRYCQAVYAGQPEFDREFRLNDDRYYCTELTVRAYRAGGLNLCEPVRIDELPRYREFPIITFLGRTFSKLKPDLRVFTPGNDLQGLWSSPYLHLVYEECRFHHDYAR